MTFLHSKLVLHFLEYSLHAFLLCPIINMVFSKFYFCTPQDVVLHSLESIFTRVYKKIFLFGLVPLAGRILRGLNIGMPRMQELFFGGGWITWNIVSDV